MIMFIDCERRMSPEEHYYLYKYYLKISGTRISYQDFHIEECLVNKYNNLLATDKERIAHQVNTDPMYWEFVDSFNREPWKYEKPVLWGDREKTSYFIRQLEESHAFEVFIDCLFRNQGVNIGLYYGREGQYHGECGVGIEIKYDRRSRETGNYYIEYQERMHAGDVWVNSGILKEDNTRFYLLGTMEQFVIFRRVDLMEYYNRLVINREKVNGARLVRENEHGTSKGFILLPEVSSKINLSIDYVIRLLSK